MARSLRSPSPPTSACNEAHDRPEQVVVLPAPLRPTRHTSSPGRDRERDAAQDPARLDVDDELVDGQHREISVRRPPCRHAGQGHREALGHPRRSERSDGRPTCRPACRRSPRRSPGRRRTPTAARSASTLPPCSATMRLEYSATRSMSCSTRMIAFTPARLRGVDQRLHDAVLVAARDAARGLVEQDHLGRRARRRSRCRAASSRLATAGATRCRAWRRGRRSRRPRAPGCAPRRRLAPRRRSRRLRAGLRDDRHGDRLGDRHRRKDVHQLEGARHAALGELHRADAGDVLALEAHHAVRSA